MKSSVEAMNKEGEGFKYLRDKFGQERTTAKLAAGIFMEPQIRTLSKDSLFPTRLNRLEHAAQTSFVEVV